MASSLPETFGERPQKESQSGSGARVDPPGLEFVRAVKELLEMGAAVMENPMVADFITSTYQGLMNLADDSYPGNDIEWHESLAEASDPDPDEGDGKVDDFEEDDTDDYEEGDTESLDDPDDGVNEEEDDDYDDDEVHRRGKPKSKPISDGDEPDQDDEDSGDLTPDESEDTFEGEQEEDGDDEEEHEASPKSRKMMARLVTSLKGLSSEFRRFNSEFRRMKGKVD